MHRALAARQRAAPAEGQTFRVFRAGRFRDPPPTLLSCFDAAGGKAVLLSSKAGPPVKRVAIATLSGDISTIFSVVAITFYSNHK